MQTAVTGSPVPNAKTFILFFSACNHSHYHDIIQMDRHVRRKASVTDVLGRRTHLQTVVCIRKSDPGCGPGCSASEWSVCPGLWLRTASDVCSTGRQTLSEVYKLMDVCVGHIHYQFTPLCFFNYPEECSPQL